MSVNEKMTAIADAIREKTGSTEKLGLDGMAEGVNDVFDEGYNNGKAEAEQTATEEKAALSLSLSEALTSGASNEESLETNVEQAKADLMAIRRCMYKNYNITISDGVLSSTYPHYIIKLADDAWDKGWSLGKSAGYHIAKSEIEEVTVTPTLEAQEILPTEPNLISKVTVKSGQALYDEGKQAQYDEFWDTAQQNGNRTDYQCGFSGVLWTDALFKPKYDIKPSNAYKMFERSRIADLKGILDKQGVVLDFSKAVSCYSLFVNCQFMTHIGEVDVSHWNGSIQECFYYCLRLHTIDKLILGQHNSFENAFVQCTSLKNILFEGVIGNNISFSSSPLTKESITSVIEHLSTTATGKTLTLKKTAVNEAFGIDVDDETTYPEGSEFYTLRHSRDNWTFSYA